jgi:amino acid adenylation domain-containing protein
LPDGNIEFLGRTDHQVKIRGFRIELGEIEAVLSEHPGVREAVVIAREDDPADRRLVAYVVSKQGFAPVSRELRSFLKEKLPDYMVPSSFVTLESFPITPNGKLDRKALPAPDQSRSESAQSYTAPRTPIEELLAEIWADVLKIDQVGIHDNFFDLGGHSLLATQVIYRTSTTCKVEIPLRFLFESPTVAGLAERIEQIGREGQEQAIPPVLSTYPHESIPLSFAQQRLWFLDQYEPNSFIYNIPSALRFKGALDVPALERTLNEIVRRHEVLRTTFSVVDGKPVQVIAPALTMSLPVRDLTDLPESERENEAQRLAMEQAREPFDLSQGPLLRVMLLRLGEDHHVLVLTMHHIVSDGWSRGVFYRELSLLYQAYIQSKPSPLPELPIQYGDFAVWQRQWLQGEVLESQLSYWKKQLQGAPALLNLPSDRPRPAVQSHRGASQSVELSEELTRSLKALSAQQGVTLFMTLLAAFLTLLHRYTGQSDIVIGSPIANRNRAEIESLIGFFVNTLVLRTDLSGDPTFQELLSRVRKTALGAYAHQDLPFEKLVEELHPERTLGHSPLFQVLFNFLESQNDRLSLQGLDASLFELPPLPAKFDLTLYAIQKPQRLLLMINYNIDLFDRASIDRMLGHFCHLLEAVDINGGRRISELSLLDEHERRLLLTQWSAPKKSLTDERSIQHLFEAQVARTPVAIALSDEHRSLTYGELNRQANQLARYLRSRGVRPGDLIPVFMERSCEMVVAVLGTLKAGAAYVPLDVDYPKIRLEYMLKDTRAALLLATTRCLERLPEFTGDVFCLDRDHHLLEREVDLNPTWATNPAELAYVVYTSGSTGAPKGVLISHRGVVRYCDFLANTYHLNGTDIVLQLASFSFDASFRDMIAPLTAGARVILVSEQEAKDPGLLIAKIKQEGVTCLLSTVPPILNALAETMLGEKETELHSIRLVLVSGEALHGALCRKIADAFGQKTVLVNQYGPTECTMTSSYHRTSLSDHSWPIVPIGRPTPHISFYVLDDDLNPTPVGVEGELYIDGEGLAAGYRNRADLTAETFIPHPYSDQPGKRLYRTGDAVRYRSDGIFAFVGRRDGQVKIRSIRVELGEIEAVLSCHEAVREAVVLAREDHPGDKRLVGYVVATEGTAAPTLRTFLGQRLPEYMVPSSFVFIPALPRSPNGKLDRKALPPPDPCLREIEESFVAPRTVVEKSLAEICSELLRIDKVGVHDNFFDLGLHSLSATQFVSRVRTKLHVKVPLRHIFEAPTVAGFASLVEKLAHENGARLGQSHSEAELIPKRKDLHLARIIDDDKRPVAIERRPLLSLIAAGKIAPVDSVALSYLSEDFLERIGLPIETALSDWFDDLPCLFGIYETHLGRIAVIGLPCLRSRLYDDQKNLINLILEALEISHRIGGRVVSLTGLIPSATNYGQAVADAIPKNIDYPLVTTGHATTVSTVVLSINRILREGGKSLQQESVAFLGLGSIGGTTLRLLLHSCPHPKSITLCDIYSKSDHLRKVRDAIVNELKFAGTVRIVESNSIVPKEVYDAGLVVGATNVPDVLDIEQLKPGTLIVDDSGPHCFNPVKAIRRLKARQDVLFTAGGVLRLPQPLRRTMYLPQRVQSQMQPAALEAISNYDPFNIGGCVLSGLLAACFDELKPTLGIVGDDSGKAHYQLLKTLGFQAADLHCLGYRLSEDLLQEFRKRFGYTNLASVTPPIGAQ